MKHIICLGIFLVLLCGCAEQPHNPLSQITTLESTQATTEISEDEKRIQAMIEVNGQELDEEKRGEFAEGMRLYKEKCGKFPDATLCLWEKSPCFGGVEYAFLQTYQGLEIYYSGDTWYQRAALLAVRKLETEEIEISNRLIEGLDIDIEPSISQEEAAEFAMAERHRMVLSGKYEMADELEYGAFNTYGKFSIWIDEDEKPHLKWNLSSYAEGFNVIVILDGHTGEILESSAGEFMPEVCH